MLINSKTNEIATTTNGEICMENDVDSAKFVEQFFRRHNELRKMHSSPELTLSYELCQMARQWANKIAQRGHVAFAEISGIGENITVFPAEKSGQQIVDHWYDENRKYEYETPGWQAGTNYFTQIVWKSTKEIGVCRTKFIRKVGPQETKKDANLNAQKPVEPEQLVVVVAFYRPAGNSNRSGLFAANVTKPLTEIVVNGDVNRNE